MNVNDIRRFIEAGNATLTVKSLRTNKHYTYHIKRAERGGFFVSVKHGHEESYIGIIDSGKLKMTRGSKVAEDAPSAIALRFMLQCVYIHGRLHEQLEVMHEGRCGRCGRPLTHPESIRIGIGPDCLEKM